ncbi:hypothetical protein GMLC_10870 [Geomonas limicola]|uniref:Uncharacterized protein n=1 Tax=Geomonas limicola TaxID=2740186 RepID=A0A6V8N4K6_9BACT|nr:hypothetical protein [Geomonas limicola]GFO67508.1 hypothetical protein GMLC_10870 [Geomonas limicola]
MAKILEFKKITAHLKAELQHFRESRPETDDEISRIVNDPSLTPAQRRWLLENLLMDLDEKLEAYKHELELAEKRLERVVKASERQIEAAYAEYLGRIARLTEQVHDLTREKGHKRGR